MKHYKTTWWESEYVDENGIPLCAVIRPVRRLMVDTDEMSEQEISEAFPDDWPPYQPASSWAEDEGTE